MKYPVCLLYNQTLLLAGNNPNGTQRNEIWKLEMFQFAELGKIRYVHHIIDTYSRFWLANALSSKSLILSSLIF